MKAFVLLKNAFRSDQQVSHKGPSSVPFFNMRYFIFKTLEPPPVSSQWKGNPLDNFYEKCPYCDSPCEGDPMCSSCHVNQIYAEEYTETFGCHCWKMGIDFEHDCTSNPELTTPNWISPEEQLRRLRLTKPSAHNLPSSNCHLLAELTLPAEILTMIFNYLDETTLLNCSRVSRRWEFVIRTHYNDELWRDLLLQRWPLFNPTQHIHNWLSAYYQMMNSLACKLCFLNATGEMPIPNFNGQEGTSREIRLEKELIGFNMSKPKGIDAVPVDSVKYNWIARIIGPINSPYEGGVFYIKLTFPQNYPYQPPMCNMLTRIVHPNISRHGQIGLTLLQKKFWTPCSTVRSILTAIEKLLSLPQAGLQNRTMCLEATISDLCAHNYSQFNSIAKDWTKKFAKHYESAL